MTLRRALASFALVAGFAGAGLAIAQQGRQPADSPDLGQRLIDGLRATPGCLGVDAGQFMSGKNAIVAWFENKAAVQRWYYSDTHQGTMGALGVDPSTMEHAPLLHIEDENAPIMVIASITFTDQPAIEGVPLPISQIAIELYAPLPGGAHINGCLAPAEFKVPHMKDYGAASE